MYVAASAVALTADHFVTVGWLDETLSHLLRFDAEHLSHALHPLLIFGCHIAGMAIAGIYLWRTRTARICGVLLAFLNLYRICWAAGIAWGVVCSVACVYAGRRGKITAESGAMHCDGASFSQRRWVVVSAHGLFITGLAFLIICDRGTYDDAARALAAPRLAPSFIGTWTGIVALGVIYGQAASAAVLRCNRANIEPVEVGT
jgi:hypothetical protein